MTEWRRQGMCTQTDPEVFFPEGGNQHHAAKRICRQCPVQAQCLEEALAGDVQFGVWGGYTTYERSRIKRGLPPRPVKPRKQTFYSEVPRRNPDGHGYLGYRRGCRCQACRDGNAAMQRAYQTQRRLTRLCEVCGAVVKGRGRHRFCSTECRHAKQRERAA